MNDFAPHFFVIDSFVAHMTQEAAKSPLGEITLTFKAISTIIKPRELCFDLFFGLPKRGVIALLNAISSSCDKCPVCTTFCCIDEFVRCLRRSMSVSEYLREGEPQFEEGTHVLEQKRTRPSS